MIRITGNADGTDHAGSAQPDRETAACGVLVRVAACGPRRSRLRPPALRKTAARTFPSGQPRCACARATVRCPALRPPPKQRNTTRPFTVISTATGCACFFAFSMQLEADFQRIFGAKNAQTETSPPALHTWRSSFCNPAYCLPPFEILPPLRLLPLVYLFFHLLTRRFFHG